MPDTAIMPELDAEEAALLEMGRQQDLSEGRPIAEGTPTPEMPVPPAKEVPSPQEPGEKPPVSPEPEPETPQPDEKLAAERQRDERGRFRPDQEAAEPEKPKSKYAEAREKEQKETERFNRSWSSFQQEKDQFRAERAQWEDQIRIKQLEQETQMPPIQKAGLGIQDYHKAYLDFRQNGDYENSLRSLETVLELQGMQQQQVAQRQESAYELAWRQNMESTFQQYPELLNTEHPVTQEIDRLINEHPYFFYVPQGFTKAAEIAVLLLAAGSDSELRDENDQLRAENERLRSGSQPARGGRGRPPSEAPRSIDEMTDQEAEASLLQQSMDLDLAMRR